MINVGETITHEGLVSGATQQRSRIAEQRAEKQEEGKGRRSQFRFRQWLGDDEVPQRLVLSQAVR